MKERGTLSKLSRVNGERGKATPIHLYAVACDQILSEIMQRGIRTCVRIQPGSDTDVFRIGAADDILRLLVDAHNAEFTISDLVGMTDATRSTVWRAVDLLDQLDIIKIRKTPQRNYVSIHPVHLEKDDPILAVEQAGFHDPPFEYSSIVSGARSHKQTTSSGSSASSSSGASRAVRRTDRAISTCSSSLKGTGRRLDGMWPIS